VEAVGDYAERAVDDVDEFIVVAQQRVHPPDMRLPLEPNAAVRLNQPIEKRRRVEIEDVVRALRIRRNRRNPHRRQAIGVSDAHAIASRHGVCAVVNHDAPDRALEEPPRFERRRCEVQIE
jgi:hypothetical protein